MTITAFTSFLGIIFTLSLVLSLCCCETATTDSTPTNTTTDGAAVAGTGAVASADAGVQNVQKATPESVAQRLEAALKTAQEALKAFYSADPLTFVNSLSNTAETLSPWITAFVAAYQNVSALFIPTPPSDADAQLVLEALKKVDQHLYAIGDQDLGITFSSAHSLPLYEFKKQRDTFTNFATAYYFFSKFVDASSIKDFLAQGDRYSMGLELANWIEEETTKPSGGSLIDYFEDSCNYTEILGRSRRVAGVFIRNAHLFTACYGLKQSSDSESFARDLDKRWTNIAKKLYENLMNKREFKKCRQALTDSLEPYCKRNQELAHQKFATNLANYFYEKFPWINWYVLSFDQGVSGSTETSCVSGTLSICLQRQYGRNLFIAGQQAEDNYFYSRNCPAHKDCKATLQQYKNCADATKPFHECIKTKCKEPAGTICKRMSDDAAVEKGKSASADGWTRWNFGNEDKYSMRVVAS